MTRRICILAMAVGLGWGWGCAHRKVPVAVETPIAPYQQFIAQNFDWSTVQRIVIMPLANQSAFPRAAEEMQANLAAEFQRAGRFEVVVATREDPGARARDVFSRGQFDEIELLRIAREYQAHAILFGNVTQYHPYSPPRVGLSLLLVSPAEGVAVASSDGVWDAREHTTSAQAVNYYRESLRWPQNLMGAERVLDSPDVYQRFVCQQVASSLSPPSSGVVPAGGPIPAGFDVPWNPPPAPPFTGNP